MSLMRATTVVFRGFGRIREFLIRQHLRLTPLSIDPPSGELRRPLVPIGAGVNGFDVSALRIIARVSVS